MIKQRFLNRISVFYKYLISYDSLVLLTCLILGVLLFQYYVNRMNIELDEVTKDKLSLVASDLDAQYDIMSQIALNVATTLYYKPFYIAKNAYYEQDITNDLAKYTGTSPIVDEFCFFFHDSDGWLYKAHGKNTFDVYFSQVLGITEWEDPSASIFELSENKLITVSSIKEDRFIFVFPFYTLSRNDITGKAFLCFFTSSQTLAKRFTDIVGDVPGNVSIIFDGEITVPVGATSTKDSSTLIDNDDTRYHMSATSPDGLFQVRLSSNEARTILAGINDFQRSSVLIMVLLVIILLIISIVLAYYNYRPIKKLESIERKLIDENQTQLFKNEIYNIEAILHTITKLHDKNREVAIEQKSILQRQIINNLFINGYQDEYVSLLQKLDKQIDVDGYCVLFVTADNILSTNINNIYQVIEQLPIEHYLIRPGIIQSDRQCGLLAYLRHGCSPKLVAEELLNQNHAFDMPVRIGVSSEFFQLQYISAAYLEAEIALHINTVKNANIMYFDNVPDEENLVWCDMNNFVDLVSKIQIGNESDAIVAFESIIEKMNDQAVFFQKRFCSNLMIEITKAAAKLRIQTDNKKIINAMTVQNLNEFSRNIKEIIHDFCSQIIEKARTKDRKEVERVLCFIQEHFTDYDMGLKLLSDKFDITPTSLSRFLKDQTGISFRQYITLLRVDMAKELLVTKHNLSIADICSAVGYESVSHFIHAFKKMTGHTPSAFRKTYAL